MTTLVYELTDTPVDIKAGLSLEDDHDYSMQYLGLARAKLNSGATAPSAESTAFVEARSSEFLRIRVRPGENIYAWQDSATIGGKITLEEIT